MFLVYLPTNVLNYSSIWWSQNGMCPQLESSGCGVENLVQRPMRAAFATRDTLVPFEPLLIICIRHVDHARTPGSAPAPSQEQHPRQLQAASSTDVISSAEVGSQNYTTADLPVQSLRIHGTFLRPRVLGRGNMILGGLVFTQKMWDTGKLRACTARFSHLSTNCVALAANDASVPVKGNTPYGTDPGAPSSLWQRL